jgi:hypothetical protein
MTKRVWLDQRLEVFIPALSPLTVAQEDQIAALCEAEMTHWRSRMNKESAMRPVVTEARKAITERIKLTKENRWMNEAKGEYQHIALKYINLDWDTLNTVDEDKLRERLKNQQLIENPGAVIAKAEKLLQSDRWEDILIALAIVTGCRETELLKTGRFFYKSLYIVTFDGQLKRRDLAVKPYEKPVLVLAESIITAWRKLRSLVDCSSLEIEEVAPKYSKILSERANYQFAGLIPQRSEKENLYTHAFRAVYARVAVHWFCPKTVDELTYIAAILGHHQAETEGQRLNFAATMHYIDYTIDGVKGVKLEEPGVQVLEMFKPKGDRSMTKLHLVGAEETDITQEETQEQQPVLETKRYKSRGALTIKGGTMTECERLIEERGFEGTGAHDRLVVDLMNHDAVAHQMYALLAPLADELEQAGDSPLATLQALINAYRASGSAATPGMGELLGEIEDEEKPIEYLRGLVERDRKFQTAIANRHSKVDYSTASMVDLRTKYKTPEAATERFRRAVDAIIAHNNAATDPLHLWYINAAMVRKLVGGKNDLVQAYLKTRETEIAEHHKQYSLTPKQNDKGMMDIVTDVAVK